MKKENNNLNYYNMSWKNTGYARKKTLAVTKGNTTTNYNITMEFVYNNGRYAALTDSEFAQLTGTEYIDRLNAFIGYVQSLNPGLATDCPDMTIGSIEYNPVSCPVDSHNQETQ